MHMHSLAILISCSFFVGVDSLAKPSLTETVEALRRNSVDRSNNSIARAISILLKDVSVLVEAIQATWKVAILEIHENPAPELHYSYGRSPPVYPSRTLSKHI